MPDLVLIAGTYLKNAKKGKIWSIYGSIYGFLLKRAFVNRSMNPSFEPPSPPSL
jgi:hypothetical protein